jgi:hypothetical protein
MMINYFDCQYADYDEVEDDSEGFIYLYGCTNSKGIGSCPLDNKIDNRKANCDLLPAGDVIEDHHK